MTGHGVDLVELTVQFLVTMAFLGLGFAGWLALGPVEGGHEWTPDDTPPDPMVAPDPGEWSR